MTKAKHKSKANLKSKEVRQRLKPQGEPYWMEIDAGLHLGYRKNLDGAVWCVRARAKGKYIKRTIGDTDDHHPADGEIVLSFTQARHAAETFHQAAQAVETPSARRTGYTVTDAVTDYLDWFKLNRKSHESTEQICKRHILDQLGSTPVNSLTTPQIDHWVRNMAQTPPRTPLGKPKPPFAIKTFTGKYTKPKGHKIYSYKKLPYKQWTPEMQRKRKSSVNRILTVLKAALNFAWRNDHTANKDAWSRVKPFENADAPRIAHLSQKQAQDLLKACSDDFRLMARAALMTGCRYGELCNLLVDDFKGDHIHIRISKTGKMRDIPLSDAGIRFFNSLTEGKGRNDFLLTHKDDGEWGRSHQTRPMLEACKKAEIEPTISFHILRHTYATLLLETKKGKPGMSIRDVAALLGDTVATCEKHYGHVIQDALKKEVVRKLPSFEGIN